MIDFLKEILGEAVSPEVEEQIMGKILESYVTKEEHSQLQGQFDSQLKESKLAFFMENILGNSGAKNQKAVEALLDKNMIDIGEQGEVTGLLEQIESLKKSDGYLFENMEIKGLKPAEKAEVPSKTPQKMNYAELCEYLKENPNAKLK